MKPAIGAVCTIGAIAGEWTGEVDAEN
jgi:hypothetical protein